MTMNGMEFLLYLSSQMMFRWFDSNQRLNDQGFIDLELPQIFYTSIFQHKSKPHISKRNFKLDAKQNSYVKENIFKKSLSRNGGGKRLRLRRAEGPPPLIS